MAVIAVWQCDRDGSMFNDKKQAEEHDKYLELAANITDLIETQVPGLSEAQSEAIGLLLAERREVLAKACKGKPELLLEPFESSDQPQPMGKLASGSRDDAKDRDSQVTSLAAHQ
ncbi:YebG family protein [Marinimicrobium alkaliphilum]|uniref:YebG family protein n=1 Tax=Marinimicrobium alkaliphilum TaxID=2202654 RepID=UPI000DB95AFF|nr:YebG family protein [Marinimicrobium alkaliphilum]